MNVYVWYRVAADTAKARETIAALLRDVEQRTGVSGRLLARVEDPTTWMEVYDACGDTEAFTRTLVERASALGVAAATGDDGRHIERFAPLVSRAQD